MMRFSTGGFGRLAAGVALLALLSACEPADERAQEHYENGLKLAESGDTARAVLEFREALRLNENFAPAFFAIAEAREREGNLQAAVGNYLRVTQVDPNHVEARIRIGRIMLAAGQLDEALKHAMAAAQLAPQDPKALSLRAAVGVQVENYDLARESAEAALKIEPNYPDAAVVLAALDLRENNAAAAGQRIDAALAAEPDNLVLNLFKLRLLSATPDSPEIPKVLTRLAEAYPKRPDFHSALVRWHVAKGDIDAAEAAARRFAEAQPENVDAALAVVEFLRVHRGADAARAELNRQIEIRQGTDDLFPFEMALVQLDVNDANPEGVATRLRNMIDAYGETANGDAAAVKLAAWKFDHGERDEALQLVENVLKHDARNADSLALRARIKLENGQYDAAIQDVRLAIAESPENWRYLMLEARAHELNGAASLVGERLGAATQVSNYEPTPVLAYARHLRNKGDADFAEGLIENALRRHPRSEPLMRALAQLKLERRDWIGAEDVAKRLRTIAGDDSVADMVLARSLEGQEQKERGIKVLEDLYEKNDGAQSSMAALVAAYVRSGQEERARSFLEDVLETTPDNLTALRLMADLHATLGENEEAEAAYRKLVELAPEAGDAHIALVRFLRTQDRAAEAEKAAQAGIEASESAALRLSYAVMLEQKGDFEGALDVYQELYEMRPQSFVVANNLASILIDRFPTDANIEKAYNVAKRLRESEVPQYQDTYGWVLYLRGEAEQALRYLRPAAEALPDVMLAQYHLGMAYAKANLTDEAVKTLKRALELSDSDDTSEQAQTARETLETLQATATSGN